MLDSIFKPAKAHYARDIIDVLRLIRSENVGPKTFFSLVDFFGSVSEALKHASEFSMRGGRARPIKICSEELAEEEIERLNVAGAGLIVYNDHKFSHLLREIHDCPPILTYKGNIELLSAEKIVAIVGARNASLNGRIFTKKLASDLVHEGFVTVSGLARGIDTEVHGVDPSRTIAVIAGGIDHIYPPENVKLFERIAKEGLLMAELPIGSKPLSQHFPQRNRIISGLSLATIVIEAGLASGSLITANFALEQNRDVFAMPGFPADPRCMGTNRLIKAGAYLLESAQDILLNISLSRKAQKNFAESENDSNNFMVPNSLYLTEVSAEARNTVLGLLSASPTEIEHIIAESGLPVRIIHTILIELELAGKITRYPGNRIALLL